MIALMGANMCFKVVSAGQAARILQSQGAIPDVGGMAGYGSNPGWLGASDRGPFGLPGSWSGQGDTSSQREWPALWAKRRHF